MHGLAHLRRAVLRQGEPRRPLALPHPVCLSVRIADFLFQFRVLHSTALVVRFDTRIVPAAAHVAGGPSGILSCPSDLVPLAWE